MGKIFKITWAGLTTYKGHFCKSKTARLTPKRAHFELPTGKGNTLGPRTLGPISLRPSKQEVKKGYNKGDSRHRPSLHTELQTIPSMRERTLTKIDPYTLMKQTTI